MSPSLEPDLDPKNPRPSQAAKKRAGALERGEAPREAHPDPDFRRHLRVRC